MGQHQQVLAMPQVVFSSGSSPGHASDSVLCRGWKGGSVIWRHLMLPPREGIKRRV
jgi:hypothetical protein